jgi:hypothetical protein
MPNRLDKLPRVHDYLNLVKTFIDNVPVAGDEWKAYRKAAAKAMDCAIVILTPTGMRPICPTKVLPKYVDRLPLILPCKVTPLPRSGQRIMKLRPAGISNKK